jgi:hypothetical protein
MGDCKRKMQAVLGVVAAACLSGIVGAADQVPFTARISGVSTFNPQTGSEDFRGLGRATHLGRSSAHLQHIVTPDIEVVQGRFTLRAANGDLVCGSYSGQGTIEREDPLLIQFLGAYTIEGGTGRFSGATGSGEISGLVDPFPDTGEPTGAETDLTFEGTISPLGESTDFDDVSCIGP